MGLSMKRSARKAERSETDPRDGVVKAMDLRCNHCGHVFRLGMERMAKDASFSCPNCGVISRFPAADSPVVQVDMPAEVAWTTLYHCSACDERILVDTFGRSHHREVRFRPCPHCGEKHSMRIVSSRGSYAEPVVEPEVKDSKASDTKASDGGDAKDAPVKAA